MSDDTKLAYQLGIMQSEINTLIKFKEELKQERKTNDKDIKDRLKKLEDWKTTVMTIHGVAIGLVSAIWGAIMFLKDLMK